ncbi:Sialyltransferase-like protein 5, partial [Mucuna pruriens]
MTIVGVVMSITVYNAQFKKFEPLEYNYDMCKTILLWEWYQNMTTVLTREYLDACSGGWYSFHPQYFHTCVIVGNSRDLLKTKFKEEIDCHDGGVELSLKFPYETKPFTCCVFIHDSSFDKKVGVRSLMNEAFTPPSLASNIYMEE